MAQQTALPKRRSDSKVEEVEIESSVDRAYEQIREMVTRFRLKPDERLNESDLAKQLGLSRTPLREALNRLSMEGFLNARAGKGFFCRSLDPQEIYELYQLRAAVECGGVQIAAERGDPAEVEKLLIFLRETADCEGASTSTLVGYDEQFHEGIMRLTGNKEMLKTLRNINDRIRCVRWIDMDRRGRKSTQDEHLEIAEALKKRDVERCVAVLQKHIGRRLEEITSSIREAYGLLYMPKSIRSEHPF
ncbi:GntR family transcriptional regulator [Bradyrhizobium sp. BWA-3-5]|uniref:GntR family transcriptional regulator n=1 Tax=Bradyrhizobium sp. BWA-3-5 TaxID=3080013 RepID=UPI00293E71A2|nr:GntR family transcriptional regulator [Bradyrhizobium sp. BWA-3-5]WOH63955.1 GntR family transcriptional regulator [Bradyrhizobium sp. BWA-3-5]